MDKTKNSSFDLGTICFFNLSQRKVVHHAGSFIHPLVFSGKTTDGKQVLKGIFEVTSSMGLPLSVVLDICKSHDFVVDWCDYYRSGVEHGMSSDRLLTRIDTEVSDVYGPEYRDEVMKRLRFFIQN